MRFGSLSGGESHRETEEINVAVGPRVSARHTAEEDDRSEGHFRGPLDGFPEAREEADLRVEERAQAGLHQPVLLVEPIEDGASLGLGLDDLADREGLEGPMHGGVGELHGLADGAAGVRAASPTEVAEDPHGQRFSPDGIEDALWRVESRMVPHGSIWY